MAAGRIPTTANSPITAKGDLFTYSTAPARLAVGSDGESLVADSSTSTGLRYQVPVNVNPVLNASMQIAQRGTSFTASNAYTLDRWYKGAAPAATFTQQATSDTTNLAFIQKCIRIQRNSGSAATNAVDFGQNFETVNSIPYAGKTVTLSFYARAGANFSATSNTLTAQVYSGTGTDQSVFTGFTGQATVLSSAVTLTTTWQRFTATATVGATATQLALYFQYSPTGTAGANDYYEITGVQLEVGSVATPFKTYAGTIQGELAACQRYYEKSYNQETAPGAVNNEVGIISAVSGNAANGNMIYGLKYAVTKRSTPTLTFYAYTGATGKVSDGGGTALAASSAFTNSTYSGTSGTRVYNNSGGSITAAYGGFEFHFTADAEL